MLNASFYPTFNSDNETIVSLKVALDERPDQAVYDINQSGQFGLTFANGTAVFVDFDAQVIKYFTGNCSQELRLEFGNVTGNATTDLVTEGPLEVRKLTKRNPVSFNVGLSVKDNCGNIRVDQKPTITCVTHLIMIPSEYGPSGDFTDTMSQEATNLNDGTYAGQCRVDDGSGFKKACNGIVEKVQNACTHATAPIELAKKVLCAVPNLYPPVKALVCGDLIPIIEAVLCGFAQSGSVCPIASAFTGTMITQVYAEGLSGQLVPIGVVHSSDLHDLNFDTTINDPTCTPAAPLSSQHSNWPSTAIMAPPTSTSSASATPTSPIYNPKCVLDNTNCLAGRGPCTCCSIYEIQQENQCRSKEQTCEDACNTASGGCSVYDPCAAAYPICTDKCWATWRTCMDSIAPCPVTSQ